MTNALATAALVAALAGCGAAAVDPSPDGGVGPGCGDAGNLASPATAAGDCLVPDGIYVLVLVPVSGRCPDDLVEDPGATWFAGLDHLDLNGVACGPIESSVATEDPERGCDLSLSYTLQGTPTGIAAGGAAQLDAECQDGTSCQHIFEVFVQACSP